MADRDRNSWLRRQNWCDTAIYILFSFWVYRLFWGQYENFRWISGFSAPSQLRICRLQSYTLLLSGCPKEKGEVRTTGYKTGWMSCLREMKWEKDEGYQEKKLDFKIYKSEGRHTYIVYQPVSWVSVNSEAAVNDLWHAFTSSCLVLRLRSSWAQNVGILALCESLTCWGVPKNWPEWFFVLIIATAILFPLRVLYHQTGCRARDRQWSHWSECFLHKWMSSRLWLETPSGSIKDLPDTWVSYVPRILSVANLPLCETRWLTTRYSMGLKCLILLSSFSYNTGVNQDR
jgi:hypothetical protein